MQTEYLVCCRMLMICKIWKYFKQSCEWYLEFYAFKQKTDFRIILESLSVYFIRGRLSKSALRDLNPFNGDQTCETFFVFPHSNYVMVNYTYIHKILSDFLWYTKKGLSFRKNRKRFGSQTHKVCTFLTSRSSKFRLIHSFVWNCIFLLYTGSNYTLRKGGGTENTDKLAMWLQGRKILSLPARPHNMVVVFVLEDQVPPLPFLHPSHYTPSRLGKYGQDEEQHSVYI